MNPIAELAWYIQHPRPGDVKAGLLALFAFGCFGVMVWLGLAG